MPSAAVTGVGTAHSLPWGRAVDRRPPAERASHVAVGAVASAPWPTARVGVRTAVPCSPMSESILQMRTLEASTP